MARWTVAKAGWCAWVAIAVATVASAAGPEARGSSGIQDASEKGEQLLNGSCIRCHDLRPIEIQALDKDAWTEVVNAMNEKGAQVEKNDVPVLVDYLVQNHGPLPDGAGKNILLNTCTLCHDLKRVLRHGATREGWEETLSAMLNEGAMLSDEDFPVLLNYLARNFKPQ
jgi:cytochrome c5